MSSTGQDLEVHDDDDPGAKKKPSRAGKWMAAQASNIEPVRRASAVHICSRWNPGDPWFSFARVIRALRREESEFLIGALALADDYVRLFNEDALRDVGSLGPFVPYEMITCEKCKREAVPGSVLCGRHGGQYLSPEDADRISKHTSGRIMSATDSAVRVLMELMDEGRSEMVRLQAATAILDRAGIGPTSKIEIDVTSASEAAANTLRERLAQTRESMEKVAEISATVVDGEDPADAVDGELIE